MSFHGFVNSLVVDLLTVVLDGELCRILMGGARVSAVAVAGIAEIRAMTVRISMVRMRRRDDNLKKGKASMMVMTTSGCVDSDVYVIFLLIPESQ